MGDIAGFQRRLFPHTSTHPVPKVPPVPRRLVDSSSHQRILPPGHPIPHRPLPGVGLDSEPPKIRVGTQTGVRFMGYQYDLLHRLVKPTQNHWESILQKVESILSNPTCQVRKFMSLIGLLTATKKQVPLGRLHMRPIH